MARRNESLCCRMIGAGDGLAAGATAGLAIEGASVRSAGMPGLWRLRGSFLKRPGYEAFRGVLARLRVELPPARPVVIRTKSFPDQTLGECCRRPERFVIRLNAKMDEPMAIETLLHEWAHALAWNFSLDKLARDPDIPRGDFEAASHDEAWGCAYSRVWRVYSAVGPV